MTNPHARGTPKGVKNRGQGAPWWLKLGVEEPAVEVPVAKAADPTQRKRNGRVLCFRDPQQTCPPSCSQLGSADCVREMRHQRSANGSKPDRNTRIGRSAGKAAARGSDRPSRARAGDKSHG